MTRADIIADLCNNGPYCCYCCNPQGEKISCCDENHFIAFEDVYYDDQETWIETYESLK